MYFLEIFDSSIWTYAIIGGVAGLLGVIFTNQRKRQQFSKILDTVKTPEMEYAAMYHYASYKKFRSGIKFYDSYGVLYIIGDTLYYKPVQTGAPQLSFSLKECTIEMEKDWRMLKWFSITTPVGEKFYFNSHSMGAFKANSEETVRGFAAIKKKTMTPA